MERIISNETTVNLIFNETENKFEVKSEAKELPVAVVELMVNSIYSTIHDGKARKLIDLYAMQLKQCRRICVMATIVDVLMCILYILK